MDSTPIGAFGGSTFRSVIRSFLRSAATDPVRLVHSKECGSCEGRWFELRGYPTTVFRSTLEESVHTAAASLSGTNSPWFDSVISAVHSSDQTRRGPLQTRSTFSDTLGISWQPPDWVQSRLEKAFQPERLSPSCRKACRCCFDNDGNGDGHDDDGVSEIAEHHLRRNLNDLSLSLSLNRVRRWIELIRPFPVVLSLESTVLMYQ